MHFKHPFTILLILVGLISCGETTPEGENTNTNDTTTVDQPIIDGDDETPDPAEAQLAQLEALNQWRRFLDAHDGELSVEKLEYSCDGWGGNLTYTRDGEMLRVIASMSGGEHGHALDKYYFDENDALVMILHEEGSWVGDEDKIAQTLYYISNNAPFYVTNKSVEGKTKNIETILNATEMNEIELDISAFNGLANKVADYRNLNAETVNAFFCN